jgi:hypothetical protein
MASAHVSTTHADQGPKNLALLLMAVAVALSLVAGFRVHRPALKIDTATFSVVAALYVATQAVERFVELTIAPISRLTGGPSAANHRTNRTLVLGSISTLLGVLASMALGLYFVSMLTGSPGDHATDAQTTKSGAVACGTCTPSTTASSAAAVQEPTSTGTTPSKPTTGDHLALSVDVLITGLTIGGGTKALHDLIDRISASSGGSTGGAASSTPAAPQGQQAAQRQGQAPGPPGG